MTGVSKIGVLDIETDSLDPTIIWMAVLYDMGTNTAAVYRDKETFNKDVRDYSVLIGHNLISFDLPVLSKLWGTDFTNIRILDTLLLSKYKFPKREKGHSLEAWGEELGFKKKDFSDFSSYSEEMEDYCINDTILNAKLFRYLKSLLRKGDEEAIKLEHEVARICHSMSVDGFAFNKKAALEIKERLEKDVQEIFLEMQEAFPPVIEMRPRSIKVHVFNPASPKQVIDKLNEFKWSPVDKTEGHKKYKGTDKKRLDRFKEYGWKINENNLSTLPDSAPPVAFKVVKYLLLIARVRKLEEWLNAYEDETGSVHGHFDTMGTWTHRFSHSNPNMGNIAAEKSIKYKTKELSEIAKTLGGEMRSLWTVHSDADYLIGTDADGIQLRIFAHYINDPKFIEALVAGDKKDGTDVHSLNAKILGGVDRDTAKTFIYAFLLGAGLRKLAEILGLSSFATKTRVEGFVKAYPGLKYLKEHVIPADASRGYFLGLDGRKISCFSEHHMLAGYLQTGEAVVMKKANVLWREELNKQGIWYRQVNFVHDEFVVEGRGDPKVQGVIIGKAMSDAITRAGEIFNCRCPLAGETNIGMTWHDVH